MRPVGSDAAAPPADAAAAVEVLEVTTRSARASFAGRPRVGLLAARDAVLATTALAIAISLGSGGFENLDPALFGYLGATIVATFATAHRVSSFWRRPASAFFARALLASLADPKRLRRTAASAARDLGSQSFIRRRSTAVWVAHLALSLGTLASFAITLPLVFGWMRFAAPDDGGYRAIVLGLPAFRFAVDGAVGWLVFHGLSLAGVAVALGASYFLVSRLRRRRLPGATASFAIAPLLLLLVVAATGLALPASRDHAALFSIAALMHQAAVVVLLVALPFSKLGHVLLRPLQLGARAVRAAGESERRCAGCGEGYAPSAQQRAVDRLLWERGRRFGSSHRCAGCRRRRLASAHASLVDAHFQPPVSAVRRPLRSSAREAS